jgi:hypothetical protein
MSHLHHRVSALIDGELDGAARRRALRHARACAPCRHELKAMLALKTRMSGLGAGEPSPDLVSVLSGVAQGAGRCGAVRSAGGATLTTARHRLAPVLRRLVVGAGSMSVALLSVAYVVGGASENGTAQVSPPVDEYAADFAGDTGLDPLSDPAVGALVGDPEPASVVTPGTAARGLIRPVVAYVGDPQNAKGVGLTSRDDPASVDDPAAVNDLRRAVMAPERFAYAGTERIETVDGTLASTLTVDVKHGPRQGTSFEVGGSDGHADATFVSRREQPGATGLGAPLELLVGAYDVEVVGPATVLGRSATVVSASQAAVLTARFWIDDATGLLLRKETYADGMLVRSTGFTSLTVDRDGFLRHLPPELEQPPVSPVSMTSAAALSDDGWTCPGEVHGNFALTDLVHVDTVGDVMRANYTDGLSTVAMFEQRGSLDPAAVADLPEISLGGETVHVRYGLPTVAVWESGDSVYTVVTDATHDVASDVIADLPHQAPYSDGVGDRLSHGFSRLGSYLNPAS